MAGVAIVLDLLKKNPSSYSSHFSATAAVAAASASVAASSYPFASRFLFGYPKTRVAYCDAGATFSEDYVASLRSDSEKYTYTGKEYYIQLKPLFSAFEWKQLGVTSLRSFLMFYLPLLEPVAHPEDDDEDFLQEDPQRRRVDLTVPFKKSVKQIARETTVVTTRRVLERLAVHYVSQRLAWKLLKDAPKSATRKAGRGLPTYLYIFRVSRTTLRAHFLGVAASWIVQVGIEIYRFFARSRTLEEENQGVDTHEQVVILGKKVSCITVRCSASLVFASIGAGLGAALIRPSMGQWLGCAVGDLAGPMIVSLCLEKSLQLEL